jgi:hypothetical protein
MTLRKEGNKEIRASIEHTEGGSILLLQQPDCLHLISLLQVQARNYWLDQQNGLFLSVPDLPLSRADFHSKAFVRWKKSLGLLVLLVPIADWNTNYSLWWKEGTPARDGGGGGGAQDLLGARML